MTHHLEITLVNRPAEVSRVQDSLEQFASEHAIPPRKLHEVQLALEEHLTNIVRYGHKDDAEHPIKVSFSLVPDELRIQIEDDGCPFNPLEHPTPDLSKPIDDRPIGGMGIHMMRKSLDGMEYRREGGKNTLTMAKRL